MVKYGEDYLKFDYYIIWSYSSLVRIIELLNTEGIRIPNLDFYYQYKIKEDFVGDEIMINEEKFDYLINSFN